MPKFPGKEDHKRTARSDDCDSSDEDDRSSNDDVPQTPQKRCTVESPAVTSERIQVRLLVRMHHVLMLSQLTIFIAEA